MEKKEKTIELLEQRIEELIAEKEFYKNVAEKFDLGITIIDKEKVIYHNQKVCDIFGYPSEQFIMMRAKDFAAKHDKPYLEVVEKQIIEEKRFPDILEFDIVTSDGNTKTIRNSYYRNLSDKLKDNVLIITTDLSQESMILREHDDNNQNFKVNNLKYRNIFYEAPLGIFRTTVDGEFVEANPALIKMLGYDSEQDLKSRIKSIEKDLYDDPKLRPKIVKEVINNYELSSYECVFKKKDGSKINVNMSIKFAYDDLENQYFLEGMVENIEERKRNEQILKDSEQKLKDTLKERDKFFNIISHDLRSPLSGLLGLSKELISEFEDMSINELLEISKALNSSAESLNKLIENLLHWSRMQMGNIRYQPVYIKPADLIKNNVELVKSNLKSKQLNLRLQLDTELIVYADPQSFDLVIRNLISNAIKFTKPEGKIEIDLEKCDDTACISIKDTGIGMSQSLQDNLFKLGENVSREGTNQESGTGLGLILSKQFIEMNNGRLNFQSEIGKGSTFHIILPVSKDQDIEELEK